MKVLDLGCGDGTTALPEAKLGADVLGVDIAANLVEAGNRRAKEAGLANCKFQEGDASDLRDLKDGSFDLVVSIFGAMFAPKPFDVAKEMTRVTRPGGRIVMGNWIPNDPTLVAQILKISSAYSPPPPEGFVSPMTWGIEDDVICASAPQASRRTGSRLSGTPIRSALPRRRRNWLSLQKILRPDDECLRRCGEERPQRRIEEGAGRLVQQPEQEPRDGRNVNPCHVFSGDRRPLRRENPASTSMS
jgi:SAM-dependent methyltransferase